MSIMGSICAFIMMTAAIVVLPIQIGIMLFRRFTDLDRELSYIPVEPYGENFCAICDPGVERKPECEKHTVKKDVKVRA